MKTVIVTCLCDGYCILCVSSLASSSFSKIIQRTHNYYSCLTNILLRPGNAAIDACGVC